MTTVYLPETHSLNRVGGDIGIDVRAGGQAGILPDHTTLANAGAMTRQQVIAVLLKEPTGMQYMDNGADRVEMLKALVELWPKSITGLNRSTSWEFAETPVSNTEVMETVTKATRERSVPVFLYDEVDGKVITRFYDDWGRFLLQDPELKHPAIINRPAYINAGNPQIDSEFKAMTVLFIEPNRSMTGVQSAYMCTNMQPKGYTDESSKVIGEALEVLEQSIEFTATTMVGESVDALALSYLDSIQKQGLVPASLAAFHPSISANVADDAVALGNTVRVQEAADALE